MPDHIYKRGLYDPEGLLSTLPAIVTALLGQFTGEFVKDSKASHKTLWMLGGAAALLGAGLLFTLWSPINKALWSSSFVLVVGAYSVAMFALFYWLIDVKGWTKWTPFFTVIGLNSITIYMAQRIIPFGKVSEFFFGGLEDEFDPALDEILVFGEEPDRFEQYRGVSVVSARVHISVCACERQPGLFTDVQPVDIGAEHGGFSGICAADLCGQPVL